MRSGLVVDTHILLWARTHPETLTSGERRVIEDAQIRYVSAVTLWEFAILVGLGRIEPRERLLDVPDGYDLLPISPDYCKRCAALPLHHRDPFDRMLARKRRPSAFHC